MESILLALIAGMLAMNNLERERKESLKGAIPATFIYVVLSAVIGTILFLVAGLFS
jgi:hypothetical protein